MSGVQPTEFALKNLLSLPWPTARGIIAFMESTHFAAISVCPRRIRTEMRQSPALSLAAGFAPWSRSTSSAVRLS